MAKSQNDGNAAPSGDRKKTVRVPKAAELVAQHLRRDIIKGDLAEGEALPSETALMEQFGISRPTLREAFRVLESEQLISVRRGARGGARVHAPNPEVAARYAGLVLEYQGTTLADVYEARVMIETPCVAVLAKRRTAADLKRLWASVEEGEAIGDDRHRLIRHHTEFHRLLVELTDNQTMALMNMVLQEIVDIANWRRVDQDVAGPSTVIAFHHGVRAHRRLVELIEARDAVRAETLWRKHLVEAKQYLLEAPGAATVLDLLG